MKCNPYAAPLIGCQQSKHLTAGVHGQRWRGELCGGGVDEFSIDELQPSGMGQPARGNRAVVYSAHPLDLASVLAQQLKVRQCLVRSQIYLKTGPSGILTGILVLCSSNDSRSSVKASKNTHSRTSCTTYKLPSAT